jgi:hypothetical protein
VAESGAGVDRVGLLDGAYADWFEDQIAVFLIVVGGVEEVSFRADGPEQDVQVSVGFLPDGGYGAGDGAAGVDDVEPGGVVDVPP